jgi:tRNA pseudouridine55 synthase
VLDGLINLYKPAGLTSATALYRVRKITRIRKSGHAGTLDAPAEGVLIICLGRATRLVETLMGLPKIYQAVARLDLTSDTLDSSGQVRQVRPASIPQLEQLLAACKHFEGRIEQIPPPISALKVKGRPAWRLARSGNPPLLAPRTVQIYWLHVKRYCWPELEFELACGRGTYVRAVVRDLGARLGTGGCLTRLVRRAIGPFRCDEAWSLERLSAAGDWTAAVVPLETARLLIAQAHVPARPVDAGCLDSPRPEG